MKNRRQYIQNCEISFVKTYDLNGFPQKVVMEGKRNTNPMIIFLHGGPGSPIPFCAGSRGLFPEITDEYTMVYWDQLGCGINDYTIDDSFTIDSFVAMTVDLIKAIHKDFPNNTISLFGVSWGSILAAKAVQQIPHMINRVVVYGQVTKELFFNDEVFTQLKAAKLSKKESLQIEEMKSRSLHGKEDVMLIAKLIRKYTQGYQAKDGGKTPMAKMIWGLLTSPDYTFKNFKALVVNGTLKNNSLYQELMEIDLTDIIKKISVPYLILQGSTDIVTSSKCIQELVQNAQTDKLYLRMIPDSGHIPGGKGMDAVIGQGFTFLKYGYEKIEQ